jgi:hypothetical protein
LVTTRPKQFNAKITPTFELCSEANGQIKRVSCGATTS